MQNNLLTKKQKYLSLSALLLLIKLKQFQDLFTKLNLYAVFGQ